MKDSVVRGRVLHLLYERRGEDLLPFGAADRAVPAPEGINGGDWLQALAQLGEYGLIDWHPVEDKSGMGLLGGFAKINEFGTEVLNTGAKSPIQISFDEARRTAKSGSKTATLPARKRTGREQAATDGFEKIVRAIEQADVSEEEKQTAKSFLLKLLESTAGTSALGANAQSLIAKYFAS